MGPYIVWKGVKFVEPGIPRSSVVENAIQYDGASWAILATMNVVDQLTKRSISSKSWINSVVVLRVVLVVRGRGKDGVQVQDSGTERIFDIAEFLIDAF